MKSLYDKALRFKPIHGAINGGYFVCLKAAHVITVNDSVITKAQRLIADQGVARLAPFLRLPFPIVFLQWSTRSLLIEKIENDEYIPDREGAVLVRGDVVAKLQGVGTQSERDALKNSYTITSVIEGPGIPVAVPHYGSFLVSPEDASAAPKGATAMATLIPSLFWRCPPSAPRSQIERDSEAELVLTNGLLALINNCPNLVAVERETSSKKGSRIGGGELFRRHRAVIRISRVQQRRSGAAGQSDTNRIHAVRGHFKVRKSGIYWWSDFMRGDPDKGSVAKSYSVDR